MKNGICKFVLPIVVASVMLVGIFVAFGNVANAADVDIEAPDVSIEEPIEDGYGAMAEYKHHRKVFDKVSGDEDATWSFCLNNDRHAPTNVSHGDYSKLWDVNYDIIKDTYFQYGISADQYTKIKRILFHYSELRANDTDTEYMGAQHAIWYILSGSSPYDMNSGREKAYMDASENAELDAEIAERMTVNVYVENNSEYQNLISVSVALKQPEEPVFNEVEEPEDPQVDNPEEPLEPKLGEPQVPEEPMKSVVAKEEPKVVKTTAPNTGDSEKVYIYGLGLAAAVVALCGLLIERRRSDNR